MPNSIEKYLGIIITVASAIGIWLISLGVFKNKFDNLNDRVSKMEAQGSGFTRESIIELKVQVSRIETRQNNQEMKQESINASLNEIKTSVKIIEAWINEQRSNK